MKADKSRKYMASTTNACESMVTQTYGSSLQTCLTICLLQLLLRIKFSVCMEVYHPVSTHLTKSETSKESKKYLTKVQCATCSGLIQMKRQAGESHLVELVIPSVKT